MQQLSTALNGGGREAELGSLLLRSRKQGQATPRTLGCSGAEMPLRGAARCEVPAEPLLQTPRPGDFQSTCVARGAQQMVGKRRRVNVSLNFEWVYDAAGVVPLYCYFSSGAL